MTQVDWCDAQAYCYSRGRRLCGPIFENGVDAVYSAYDDPAVSQWMNACSAAGTSGAGTLFSYGDSYSAGTCADSAGPVAVASRTDCHAQTSPFSGLFDLSANVAEWEDALACGTSGSGDCYPFDLDKRHLIHARIRGFDQDALGTYDADAGLPGPAQVSRCAGNGYGDVAPINHVSDTLGFRCCEAPKP